MPSVPTLTVYWPAKFGQRAVVIDADTFDPAVHRLASDGPPAPAAPKARPPAPETGGETAYTPRRRRRE